jgi:hypothetical protein
VLRLHRDGSSQSEIQRVVSSAVISTWATLQDTQRLFPRLSDLLIDPNHSVHLKYGELFGARGLRAFLQEPVVIDALVRSSLSARAAALERVEISALGGLDLGALFVVLSSSAAGLRQVALRGQVAVRNLVHLASFSSLTHLEVRSGTNVPEAGLGLEPDAFCHLKVLKLADVAPFDMSPTLPMLHFFFALPSHNHLRSFKYDGNITYVFLMQLVQRVSQWRGLHMLQISVSLPDRHASYPVEDTRAIVGHLCRLPLLEAVICSTDAFFVIDESVVRQLVRACLHLHDWWWLLDGAPLSAIVSLRTLLDILRIAPNARALPLCMRCDDLPGPEELGGISLPKYTAELRLQNVTDPTAVFNVLRTVLPGLSGCTGDRNSDSAALERVRQVNEMLKAAQESV